VQHTCLLSDHLNELFPAQALSEALAHTFNRQRDEQDQPDRDTLHERIDLQEVQDIT
jgi:hypothetical protein